MLCRVRRARILRFPRFGCLEQQYPAATPICPLPNAAVRCTGTISFRVSCRALDTASIAEDRRQLVPHTNVVFVPLAWKRLPSWALREHVLDAGLLPQCVNAPLTMGCASMRLSAALDRSKTLPIE